jgi:hypothetical protein
MSEATNQNSRARFSALEAELTKLKQDYVDGMATWYERHAPINRVFFRVTGVLVILSSVTIPFLTGLNDPHWKQVRDIALPVAALLVAFLTGLNAFFGFHGAWQKQISMHLFLEQLGVLWRFRMTEARHTSDEDEACKQAVAATKELLESAASAIATETTKYFEAVREPLDKATSTHAKPTA